jgi:FkbM family methyltransferase
MHGYKITALICTKNEAQNLPYVLPKIPGWVGEIIVVDGHSSDGTVEVAKRVCPRARVLRQPNIGKGDALKYGIEQSIGDIIVTMDADGTDDPEDMGRFVAPIFDGCDFAKGSRFVLGRPQQKPWYRIVGNWIITATFDILFLKGYTDICCGYNAFRKESIQRVDLRSDDIYSADEPLIHCRVARAGLRVAEVGCLDRGRISGETKMPSWRHGFKAIKTIVRERCGEGRVSLCRMAVRLFRGLSATLATLGFDRVLPFYAVYWLALNILLPKGKRDVWANGSRMAVSLGGKGTMDLVGMALVVNGEYEPQTTRYFKKLVKPGMRVVDVGANIGYYTLLAQKLVGRRGKVWSFEPEGENFADLCGNIRLNNGLGTVMAIQKAVSDRDGRARMYLAKDSGAHSLVLNWGGKSVGVETVKLDSIIKGRVDVVKTDTEGNEVAVLRGAERLLKRNRDIKLFVELQFRLLGKPYMDALADLLYDCGFRHLYLLDESEAKAKKVTLRELRRYKWSGRYTPNILCSKTAIKGGS